MSLVADYTDSDEDHDHHDENNSESEIKKKEEKSQLNNGSGRTLNVAKNQGVVVNSSKEKDEAVKKDDGDINSRDSSPESESTSSGSDTSDEDEDDNKIPNHHKKRNQQNRIQLDNPFRSFGDVNVAKEDSVFRNPFRDKEDERIAVLEKHVKMTENPETALTINGKKICWNYRKRKCYLGTQCPYAHDSDVLLTEEQLKEQKLENDLHRSAGAGGQQSQKNAFASSSSLSSGSQSHLPGTASVVAGGYDSSAFFTSPHLGGGGGQNNQNHSSSNSNDFQDHTKQPYNTNFNSSKSSNSSNHKKRVGLSNSLIPPKKAFNMYLKTKDK